MLDLYLFNIDDQKVKNVKLPKHIFDHVERYTETKAHALSLAAWNHTYTILNKYKFDWNNLTFKDDVPQIKNSKIYFNISHSNKLFAIAVSDCPVGVDVQEIVSMHQCNCLYPRIFVNCEHLYLNSPNPQKTMTEAFTQYECAIKLAQPKFVPNHFNSWWIGDQYCLTVINTNNDDVKEIKKDL